MWQQVLTAGELRWDEGLEVAAGSGGTPSCWAERGCVSPALLLPREKHHKLKKRRQVTCAAVRPGSCFRKALSCWVAVCH